MCEHALYRLEGRMDGDGEKWSLVVRQGEAWRDVVTRTARGWEDNMLPAVSEDVRHTHLGLS